MRYVSGVIVFGLGVLGLSYWGSVSHAKRVQTQISAAAQDVAQGTIHGAKVTVSGRDLTVSGYADGVAERDSILVALNRIPGRRVVRDNLEVLVLADPFVTEGAKSGQGQQIRGAVPTMALRSLLASRGLQGAQDMTLAAGAPDGWNGAVDSAVAALAPLEFGAWSLEGKTLRFSGEAQTPTHRNAALEILQILPEGFAVDTVITVQDDGTPPVYAITYNAATGVAVTGKLPFGVAPEDLAGALGVSSVIGDARASLIDRGRAAQLFDTVAKLRSWLDQFDLATLEVSDQSLSLTASAVPGTNIPLVRQELSRDLTDVTVILQPSTDTPPENSQRTNAATGLREQVVEGYWLPVLSFDPTIARCSKETEAAQTRTRIQFLTGSSELGPRAVLAINRLAAAMRPCILDAGLSAELGGHTDNTGDLGANMQLSLERAEAVRDALSERGIPLGAMSAAGYGASRPIADNSTEEGRTRNRRTTITWQTGQ